MNEAYYKIYICFDANEGDNRCTGEITLPTKKKDGFGGDGHSPPGARADRDGIRKTASSTALKMILIFNYDFWYDCESIRQDSKVTIQFIGKACLLTTKIKRCFQMFNVHTGSLKIQVQIDVCTNKRSHHFTEKTK